MSFGLSNALNTFMRVMNQALRSFIGKFVAVNFEDILLFSNDLESHMNHLQDIIKALRRETLYAVRHKCIFIVDDVLFLGYICLH